MPLVYDELKHLAAHYLRRERLDHTLQCTALVHEAYLKMVRTTEVDFEDRSHFFGIAARMIRQILVDHARSHQASKRDSGGITLSLDEAIGTSRNRDVDLIRLDDALQDLQKMDERQSRIVELRFFAGLSIEEASAVIGVSPMTLKREWAMARAWLFRELRRDTV